MLSPLADGLLVLLGDETPVSEAATALGIISLGTDSDTSFVVFPVVSSSISSLGTVRMNEILELASLLVRHAATLGVGLLTSSNARLRTDIMPE